MFFSIIIPMYNAEKTIARCLQSIVEQSEISFEIIIVNDGSVDKSEDICKVFCEKNSSMGLYQTDHLGASAARNRGIQMAKGEYLLFVDADDLIDSNMLKNIKNEVQYNNAEICYMNSFYVVSEGKKKLHKIFDYAIDKDKTCYSKREFLKIVTAPKNIFPGSMCIIACKREFVIKHSIWLNEKAEWSEDSDFSYNLFIHSNKIAVCNFPGYNYFIDTIDSVSKEITINKMFSRMDIYSKWYNYFIFNEIAIRIYDDKDRIKIAQQILDNYCLFLKQLGTFSDKKINIALNNKLCLEERIWKSTTNYNFLFYKLVGLKIGTVKNILFRKTRICLESILGKRI